MADEERASSADGGASEAEETPQVKDIIKGKRDSAGDVIVSVFAYSPPEYAIYRTRERLKVQFHDARDIAGEQRKRLSPLAAMRGQINGLIDGWHSAGLADPQAEPDSGGNVQAGPPPPRSPLRNWIEARFPAPQVAAAKRAARYDRRVADALIILLEDPQAQETAQTLLFQVKNDIIAERTSIARFQYVRWAFYLVTTLVLVTWALSSQWFFRLYPFQRDVIPAWTAVAGGGFGAFFSLAIGLKSREVSIDLQKLENLVDVLLRMLIGAVAGGVFFALLATELVQVKLVNSNTLDPALPTYSDITVFLIGFVAGFLERLVPNLLNKTNFGTSEPAGQDTPVKPPPPPPPPPPEPTPPPPPVEENAEEEVEEEEVEDEDGRLDEIAQEAIDPLQDEALPAATVVVEEAPAPAPEEAPAEEEEEEAGEHQAPDEEQDEPEPEPPQSANTE